MKIKLHPVWTLFFKTYIRFKQTYINKYMCVFARARALGSTLSEFQFFSTVSSVAVTMLYIRSSDYSTDFLQMYSVRVSARNRWNTQIAELGERLIKRAYLQKDRQNWGQAREAGVIPWGYWQWEVISIPGPKAGRGDVGSWNPEGARELREGGRRGAKEAWWGGPLLRSCGLQ